MQVLSLLFVAFLTAFATSTPTWKIEDSGQKKGVVSELSIINKHTNDDQILQFSALGQKYSLPIQVADDIFAPNFQIKTESNSSIVDYGTDRLKGKFYTAKNGRGSFYIENTGDHLAVDGIVDNQIRIRSVNGNHMAFHTIPNPNSNAFSNDMVKHLPYTMNKIIKDEDTEPLPDVITIEVFTVVDSILHKSLIKNGISVEKYLGLLWNQVQNEYKSFSNPKINFVIVGSTVLTNVTDWMKLAILEEKDNITEVNSHGLIVYFGHWLFTKLDDTSIPNYDIAIMHTGLDLASPIKEKPGTYMKENLGVAHFEKVCLIDSENEVVFSSGVMEDLSGNPDTTGILIITHEVGHLLGAAHDNELPKERHCPDNYIMYWSLGEDTTEKFSKCSINDVKKHLSLKKSRCVRERSSPK